jgi:ferritin
MGMALAKQMQKGALTMIGKKLESAINNQIQAEMYSANLYLAMSYYTESKNLKGAAHWLNVQYQEESTHFMKFLGYLSQRGGKIELQAVEAPPSEFGSPLALFEKVLLHEQHVSSLINDLYTVAVEEKDYAAQMFLQWFITEQVEEEASASDVIEKLRLIGNNDSAIFYIDQELAKRTFVPDPAAQNQKQA